jgi:PadR family transcriptional regulator PadR
VRDAIQPVPESAEKWEVQLRKGSLELAILASLWDGRLYGLEILRYLESKSELVVVEGTAYPLLNRLRALGLVESEWVESDQGHPRKYYSLTAAGRQRAVDMSRIWARFSGSMTNLLVPLKNEIEQAMRQGREEKNKDGQNKEGNS